MIKRLREHGVRWSAPDVERVAPLSGKTFVLTGTLSGMTREQGEERLRSLGAHVGSNVSTKTDYLVCGNKPGPEQVGQGEAGRGGDCAAG